MDRDEDILFLFLTSHGSKERFSLDFWPIDFKALDPKNPAGPAERFRNQAARHRGVRVLFGSFVDALKDENSLVITASAADHNSFGCSNEADFTYFGKAFFDEALRETYSFIEASKRAKPKIAAREKEQDYEGSEPQISIGEGIRKPLARSKRGSSAGRRSSRPPQRRRWAVRRVRRPLGHARADCKLPQRVRAQHDQGVPRALCQEGPQLFRRPERELAPVAALMVAWAKIFRGVLRGDNNEKLFRQIYLDSYRRQLAERDLDAAVEFFRTEPGQRFVNSTNGAAVDLMRGVLDVSRPFDRTARRGSTRKSRCGSTRIFSAIKRRAGKK